MNPRKSASPQLTTTSHKSRVHQTNASQSEGEVKLAKLDKDVINLYGEHSSGSKRKPFDGSGGVNRIIRSSELGEVQSTSYGIALNALNNAKYDKSDGEAEGDPDLNFSKDVSRDFKKSTGKKKNRSSTKTKITNESKEKNVVELQVSAKQPKAKNNIRIESLGKFYFFFY